MKHKIIAAILGFVNVLMVAYALQLAYLYQFSEMEFAFKLSGYLLLAYVLVGSFGLLVDVRLFKDKLQIRKALLYDLLPKMLLFGYEMWGLN